MCSVLWPQRLWKDDDHKAGERVDPAVLSGNASWTCAGGWSGIAKLPMYQIAAKIGSVFQNPRTQFFNVDTDSEIAFGLENAARPPLEIVGRVVQTAEDLRIQELRQRNIFELSGGEKQKIAFASVYAMNRRLSAG